MEISIDIIKVVNNEDYVSVEDENYCELTFDANRIWLSEQLNIVFEKNRVYNLKLKSGDIIEGRIIEIGQDELGFFIIFKRTLIGLDVMQMMINGFRLNRKEIITGNATLEELFAPDTIEGGKELIEYCEGKWPNFYGSIVSINEQNTNFSIDLIKGDLGKVGVELHLFNVCDVKCSGDDCNNLEYFYNSKIKKLDIKKLDDLNYRICIEKEDVFTEFNPIDELTCDEFSCNVEVRRNEAIIHCSGLKINYYNSFLRELEEKGIILTKLYSDNDNSEADKLRSKWLEAFTKNIDISNDNIDQELWHVFSYGSLPCLEKEDANAELIKVKKDTLYIFLNEGTMCYRLDNAEKFTSENIDYFNDIYVTDENFTWTYVLTHEGMCGPYFYSK